jgi:hypothetical protein
VTLAVLAAAEQPLPRGSRARGLYRPRRHRNTVQAFGREGAPEEAGAVPTVVAYHDIVKNKNHWLSSPKRDEVFGPVGVTNIRTFVDPQDSSKVAIVMDVADMDALMTAMQQPAAGEAMESDGVATETIRFLIEEKHNGG